MENLAPILLSLDDVDSLVDDFLSTHAALIKKNWQQKNDSSTLGYDAFIVELTVKLKNSCITYLNTNKDLTTLHAYLFPTVFVEINKYQSEMIKKISQPICPAHKFLGIEVILQGDKVLKCLECENKKESTSNLEEKRLFTLFSLHNKQGYKCTECSRFIPKPLDSDREIICPYFDCCFVGNISQLSNMRHPAVKKSVKLCSLDAPIKNTDNLTGKDLIESLDVAPDSEFLIKESLLYNINTIKDVIDSQINSLYYTGSDATRINYLSMYESFKMILNRKPEEMVSYLVYLKRGENLQHLIFQEYIRILEKNLPFGFKKNGKNFRVTSLLDENLYIFDGISIFDNVVNNKLEIKNNTQEFYIGGRKAFYSRPFYIGKLLDIVDTSNNTSILSNVVSYSFSKIKMKNIAKNSNVRVTHLRIPPHHQMGGLSYLNRVRRRIVDKVYFNINGTKRETK